MLRHRKRPTYCHVRKNLCVLVARNPECKALHSVVPACCIPPFMAGICVMFGMPFRGLDWRGRTAAPSLAPTLRSLVPTWCRVTCAHVLRHLCPHPPHNGSEGGGRGKGGMITTLFHAASTTTSSHPRGQHDQSPAPQRVRRGEGGKAGGEGHPPSNG